MIGRPRPSIGDPVEVRFFSRLSGRRNAATKEVWKPATVSTRGGPRHIGVTFADHGRMDVRDGEWRTPRKRRASPEASSETT